MQRKTLGRILIWLGVVAWIPYFLLQWFAEVEPPMWPFLTGHLVGVLGGGAIKGSAWLQRRRRER